MSGKRTSAGWADADGITLRRSRHEPVTVSFDDQMVWAVDPARAGSQSVGGVRLPWPAGLAAHLQGRTRVRVRSARNDVLLVDAEVAFDDSDGRVRVTDRQGRPLMLNKVGTLGRANATVDEAVRREALQHGRDLIDVLQEAGVDAFLNYGALLGAVRENGRVIGHDNDIDLVYLSRHQHPADVIAESWRLERIVRETGLGTVRMSGGDFKVSVRLSDGRSELIDVFAGFHVDGVYHQLGNRSGQIERDDILPLATLDLEGVSFPVPRRPERMLEFLYGPHWRTPDPSFTYDDPPDGVRRLNGWLRGFRTETPPWNRFFESPPAASVPTTPSALAIHVGRLLAPASTVVDIGSGNGRDSLHFAALGHHVRSLDGSARARQATRRLLRSNGHRPDIAILHLNDLRHVLAEGLLHRGSVIHARHLLDSVNEVARDHFFRLARVAGARVHVEFSSGRGRTPQPRLRRRLDPDQVLAAATRAGGRLVGRHDGPGQDIFDHPDPQVTRLELDYTREHS